MQVPTVWDIPQELRAHVADRVGRQRALISDGHLLIVLHKVPAAGKPERKGTLFWRKPAGEWVASETGGGLQVLHKHIEAYDSAVDAQEAEFEKADSAAEYHEVLQAISPLHRAANHMHAVLQTAREAFRDDAKLGSMSDWAYDMSRAADLLHTDARNAIDYELARQSSVQADASRRLGVAANRLNMIAALFLPLMALASVFGMNLRSGLDQDHPLTFWAVVAGSTLLGFLVWMVVLWAGRGVSRQESGRRSS